MKPIDNILDNKKCRYLFLIVGVVTVIIPIIGSLINGAINCDSAYYLSMVERISEGYVPYKTLHLGYTPLWFYWMAGLKYIFAIPYGHYELYLFFHYCIQIGCAFFIYKIIRSFSASKEVSMFSAWLFLIMVHWLDGNVILLELPSVFWGLCGCWCILRFSNKSILNYLWIGVLTSFAFLSKQFGFGFFFLALYLMLISSSSKLGEKCCFFVVGYALPIVFCLIIWGDDFISIVFSGYGTTTAQEAGWNCSIQAKFDQITFNLYWFLIRVVPIVLVSFCYILSIIKQNKGKEYLFCILGILGFSCQFYFTGGGHHYTLYMVPFAIILIGILFTLQLSKLWKYILMLALFCTTALSLYSTYHNRCYKHYLSNKEKHAQQVLSDNVKRSIPKGSTLWIVHGGIYYIYYTTNILPPNIETIGYSFGPLGLSEKKAMQQAEHTDFILRFSKDYPYESFFTPRVKKYVEQYPIINLQDSVVLLHKCR